MRKTQFEVVIDRLNEKGYVDNYWAISNHILRLGAIIARLKKQGWQFTSGFGTGHNRKNYIYRATKIPFRVTAVPGRIVISGKEVEIFKKKDNKQTKLI